MNDITKDQPQSVDEYLRQGWGHYGRGDLTTAEERFRKAISLGPALIDAFYGLGLTLKAQGRKEEAVEIFLKLVVLLEKDTSMDSVRRTMLQRLTQGQINLLKFGDWGLEKETWKHER
jgi:tetratricopeptide (TPR) repeat protein